MNVSGGNTPVRKRSFSLHPDPAAASGELAPSPIIVTHVKEKPTMASVIVLDASVLVYGLAQVKRWCKDERKEILIVPLEGDINSPQKLPD